MYINNHRWREGIVFWDEEIDTAAPVDIIFLIHELVPGRGEYVTQHVNYEHALESRVNLFANYSATLRNTISKSRHQGLAFEINARPDVATINAVTAAHNAFASGANLPLLAPDFLLAINANQKLIITAVTFAGEPLFMHTFYRGANRVRLYHSFPVVNHATPAINALANAALHDYELTHFYDELGITTYDWGGAGRLDETSPKKLAIRDFKRRFGGQETIYFKGRIPVGANGETIRATYYKV